TLFGRAYWIGSRVLVRTGLYDVLKVRGLELIRNDSLRFDLARLYQENYAYVDDSNKSTENAIYNVLRPYFLVHFQKLDPGNSAHPLNYAAVISDPYFENILQYRRTNIDYNALISYKLALRTAQRVVTEIDHELK